MVNDISVIFIDCKLLCLTPDVITFEFEDGVLFDDPAVGVTASTAVRLREGCNNNEQFCNNNNRIFNTY